VFSDPQHHGRCVGGGLEVSAIGSSSEDSLGGGSGDGANADVEDIGAVDPLEYA
jgi:hypothetical protein